MELDLGLTLAILRRTPSVLRAWLQGLPEAWTRSTEGPDTWSAFDVVGHLIHGERTDWIPRARFILQHGTARAFEPFDRFAQLRLSEGRTLDELLGEFESLRGENVSTLVSMDLTPEKLTLRGRHPELGEVTLSQHLATWTAHDLNHLHQIARVMARQYEEAVGPWIAYLGVLDRSG